MLDLFIDFNNGMGEQSLTGILPRFKVRSFTADAPNIDRETTTLSRINGLVLPQHPRDVVYKERGIKVEFLLDSIIAETFYQNRHELYDLLVQPFPYYISTDLLPNRRFLVTCDGNFTIPKDKQKNYTAFTVDFTDILGLPNRNIPLLPSRILTESIGVRAWESCGEMILNTISRIKSDSVYTIPAAPRSTLCSMITMSFCGRKERMSQS